jgi:hypothetical protein
MILPLSYSTFERPYNIIKIVIAILSCKYVILARDEEDDSIFTEKIFFAVVATSISKMTSI